MPEATALEGRCPSCGCKRSVREHGECADCYASHRDLPPKEHLESTALFSEYVESWATDVLGGYGYTAEGRDQLATRIESWSQEIRRLLNAEEPEEVVLLRANYQSLQKAYRALTQEVLDLQEELLITKDEARSLDKESEKLANLAHKSCQQRDFAEAAVGRLQKRVENYKNKPAAKPKHNHAEHEILRDAIHFSLKAMGVKGVNAGDLAKMVRKEMVRD